MSSLTSGPQVLAIENPPAQITAAASFSDFVSLAKPRIVVMELIVVLAAAVMAGCDLSDSPMLMALVLGTGLVAGSAGTGNQILERSPDALMPRTARRPVPTGRIRPREAWILCSLTLLLGLGILALGVNLTTSLLGAVGWLLYVALYTPLKYVSVANTWVGAAVGAVPVLMGWSSVGNPLDLGSLGLACSLFLWQFPHFMAIAWLYRRDYARSGAKMLTVVEPSGFRAAAQGLLAAIALLPVSVLPLVSRLGSGVYFVGVLGLGLLLVLAAVKFLVRRDDASAKLLLKVSLLYLPGMLMLLALASLH